jgi:hypothetical protein
MRQLPTNDFCYMAHKKRFCHRYPLQEGTDNGKRYSRKTERENQSTKTISPVR